MLHHCATASGKFGSKACEGVALSNIFRVLTYRCGELFHTRGGFFQRSRSLFRALGQVEVTSCYLRCCDRDRFG